VTPRFWLLLVLFLALAAFGAFVVPRLEGDPPELVELSDLDLGRTPRPLVLEVSDGGSGLRSVEVRILSSTGTKSVAAHAYPGSLLRGGEVRSERIEVPLDAAALGLRDGPANLMVAVRDWSLRDALAGNALERQVALRVDTQAPKLSVDSGLTYVYRGGSGAVVYRIAEETASDGVRVGDAFFPGHPLSPGPDAAEGSSTHGFARIAIFAIPALAPKNPSVLVVARDLAGNEGTASFPVRVFDRDFGTSDITLSQGFLESKVRPLAEANGLESTTLREAFRQVNETLRARNEETIRGVVGSSASTRHWQGAFQQMHNSQVTSRFAERRTYLWEGGPISKAVHYGFDLASTAGAPVVSSNAGVVVFADDLGIYGRCVILDHGLGVHSLYAHLSQIDASVGDPVSSGQTLGRSGQTGLAGGDHLHFAILVGGEYVDPVEWWDPKWVRSHVEVRLSPETAPPQG
jgi:murein DD-endopeptidase MepM/ murein hydrolase activator NlpD